VNPVAGTTVGSKVQYLPAEVSVENEHEIRKNISKNGIIAFNFVFRKYGLTE
jgi:hypothetical protein